MAVHCFYAVRHRHVHCVGAEGPFSLGELCATRPARAASFHRTLLVRAAVYIEAAGMRAEMTPNKQTVTRYMDGFRASDRELILSCLTEDVSWSIPGMFDVQGKAGFAAHIVDEGFAGQP